MVLNVINNPYHYELQKLTSAFFPSEPVEVHTEPPFENGEGTTVTVSLENLKKTNSVIVSIRYYNSETKREAVKTQEFPRFTGEDDNLTVSLADSENSLELKTAQMLYSLLSEVLSVSLSWGILTGIRPSKLLIRLMNEKGRDEGIEYFKNCFFVSDKKTSLALSVADAEEKIAVLNPEKIGWYFTETAIVCYLEPYTIALPEEGYVEAELPIEDDRE